VCGENGTYYEQKELNRKRQGKIYGAGKCA